MLRLHGEDEETKEVRVTACPSGGAKHCRFRTNQSHRMEHHLRATGHGRIFKTRTYKEIVFHKKGGGKKGKHKK